MEVLSPDVQALVKRAAEWTMPHNPENIKRIDGNICGPNTTNRSTIPPPNTDLFPLSEFLTKNTIGPFQFLSEPIKKPFLSKLPSVYHEDALEIFKIVLILTTDTNLSDKERYLLIDFIFHKSISCGELRDEIILQVLNQTSPFSPPVPPPPPIPPPPPPPPGPLSSALFGANNNVPKVSNRALDRPWMLLADCLSCFKPSFNFQNYVLNHLSNGVAGSYETFCADKLHQNCSSDEKLQRSYPPCMLERFSNKYQCVMALKCNFSDETVGCGQVTSWMLAQDFASEVLLNNKNLPANHSKGWTVALRDTQGIFECQGRDFVLDLISELEVSATFCFQPANFLVTKLSPMPVARYIHEEHPHNIHRKRTLTEPDDYFADKNNLQQINRKSSNVKQYEAVRQSNPEQEKSRKESFFSDSVPTNWIDDVFEGVLNDDFNKDASHIASKIKGGIEDQTKPGSSTPQYVSPPQPYMSQPYMPMMIPNPSMMYHVGANAYPQPPSSHHLDHLFFQVDPHKRMEANNLRVQLETKELEKRVLETTLHTEVLKQQLQELKSFSIPSRQQQQQQFRHHSPTSYYYPHQQQQQQNDVPPKTAMKGTTSMKNRVSFQCPPNSDASSSRPLSFQTAHGTDDDEGSFQMTSAINEESFRKVGKLGKITWPPEGQVKVEEKPRFNPRRLLLEEKKSQEISISSYSKLPPKPPPKTKYSPATTGHMTKFDNQNKAEATNLNLSCVRKKLEQIFSKGSVNNEPVTPADRDSKSDGYIAPEMFSTSNINFPPTPTNKDDTCKSTMTYVGVDWELEIRKEFFSPQEKLENNATIDLIYRQIVRDGLSKHCVRLTDKCSEELMDVFGKLQITSPNTGSTEMKLLVIEVAKKLPFYFSRMFPIKINKNNVEINQLAIACEGISLLTFSDDLSFIVHQFIRFEEIIKVEMKSKTQISIESVGDSFTFDTLKAAEVQSLIESHKKEKLELQIKLDAIKNSYYDKIGEPIMLSMPKQQISMHPSSDDGIVMKVHAGSKDILIEILPEMTAADVIEFICSVIDVTSPENQLELILTFVQGQMWTSLMKDVNAFSAMVKMFNVPQDKIGTNEEMGEATLLRGSWVNTIDLKSSSPIYLDVLYSQSISDYLCGYYLPVISNIIPASILEDISVLVALQFQIENSSSAMSRAGLEKYIPRNIWSMVDMDYLCPLIINQSNAIQKSKLEKKKILSLEILSKMPLFGSVFFQCSVENKECILAVHRYGLYFLNADTNVAMTFHPFKSGISVFIDESNASPKKLVIRDRKDKKGSENTAPFSIASRGAEQILALIELHNSILNQK